MHQLRRGSILVTVALVSWSLHGCSDGTVDAGQSCVDLDQDSYGESCLAGPDCDDTRRSVAPGEAENCSDSLDNNCDGAVDEADSQCSSSCQDADGDGYHDAACGGSDCNDSDPDINPSAVESCSDDVDSDCDGAADGEDPDCATVTCVVAAASLHNEALPQAQTGTFELGFVSTPSRAQMDSVIGLATGVPTQYSDLAAVVRFAPTGVIDARNGGSYQADAAVTYAAGVPYGFRLVVDVASRTYDVFVAPNGGAEVALATSYAFRSEQSAVTMLTHWAVTAEVGSQAVCDFTFSGGTAPPPSAIPQPPSLDTVPMPSDAIMVGSAAELTAALQSAVGGETIALASGAYGVFAISNKTYSSTVFVRPQVGATPVFKSLTVTACKKMQIAGLSILPRRMNGDTVGLAVELSGANEDIIFEKSLISYADDSSGWTAQNWLDYAYNGIVIHGNRMIVRDNFLYNTAFALDNEATNSLVSRNHINGFRADGMRGQGDYSTFEYNDVRNCVQVDENHADGFQAFTMGAGGPGTGTITGVNLIGNTIIDNEDMSDPLKCQLQGIGLFDGTYVGWVIENNLVVTDMYHGITILGSVNGRIINNTVIDHDFGNAIRPWIMLAAHKDGTPSVGGIVRNNISYSVSTESGTTSDHNLIVDDASLATVFVDPAHMDFRLRAGSPAIDAGAELMAPALDLLALPRSIPIDLGAYDFQ